MDINLKQPSDRQYFDYYDASFEPDDALISGFNVIDKKLLDIPRCYDEPPPRRIDPRTKETITQNVYDHSTRPKHFLLKSVVISTLSRQQHNLCLGFLQSVKSGRNVRRDQIKCINETAEKREAERQDFLQFLDFYNEAHFHRIYSAERTLEKPYKTLYEFEAQRMLNKHGNGTFQLNTGFPLPSTLYSMDSPGQVTHVKTLFSEEPAPMPEGEVDFSVLGANLEKFLNVYLNQESNTKERSLVSRNGIDFEIPIDTLVFFLCGPGDVDTPTEVVITVLAEKEGLYMMQISEPLPVRCSGAHTADRVVNKCLKPFLNNLQTKDVCPEIEAACFPGKYSLLPCDEYMKRFGRKPALPTRHVRNDVIEWNLGVENSEKRFTILTRIASSYIDAQQRRVFPYIKLEFKPEVGCEVMSKYNLLREWFEHKICGTQQVLTERYRLKTKDFKCIQRESRTLAHIEEELRENYRCNMILLTSGLWSFLSLLKKLSPGRHLLCYNPNYKEKLMLYSETNAPNSKSITVLHDLLQQSPKNIEFKLQMKMVPVSSTVFSDVHTDHRVLPCAFPPGPKPRTSKYVPSSLIDESRLQQATRVVKRKKQTTYKRNKKKKANTTPPAQDQAKQK